MKCEQEEAVKAASRWKHKWKHTACIPDKQAKVPSENLLIKPVGRNLAPITIN